MIRRPLLAIALLAGLAAPAPAAVLFAGGEDTDYLTTSTPNAWFGCDSSAGAACRLGWARTSPQIGAVIGGMTNVPPSQRMITPTFTAGSTVWVHAIFSALTCLSTETQPGYNILGLASPDGVWRILVQGNGANDHSYRVHKRNSAGVQTLLANSSVNDWPACAGGGFPAPISPAAVDIKIVYAVSGSIDVYINGAASPSLTYTGDTTTDGTTQLNQLFLGAPGVQSASWSEVIVADADIRRWGVVTVAPNGVGNSTDWPASGGSAPCSAPNVAGSYLGAAQVSAANYVWASTESLKRTCTVGSPITFSQVTSSVAIPAGAWRMPALVMSGAMLKGSARPQNFRFVTRVGGADYASSDRGPAGVGAYEYFPNYIQATNPAGGGWSTGAITNPAFNIGLESRP